MHAPPMHAPQMPALGSPPGAIQQQMQQQAAMQQQQQAAMQQQMQHQQQQLQQQLNQQMDLIKFGPANGGSPAGCPPAFAGLLPAGGMDLPPLDVPHLAGVPGSPGSPGLDATQPAVQAPPPAPETPTTTKPRPASGKAKAKPRPGTAGKA